MENLEIVKAELERVKADGHDYETGRRIVKKLSFTFADEVGDCVMEIAKQNNQIFLEGFLDGIERKIKMRAWDLMSDDLSRGQK